MSNSSAPSVCNVTAATSGDVVSTSWCFILSDTQIAARNENRTELASWLCVFGVIAVHPLC